MMSDYLMMREHLSLAITIFQSFQMKHHGNESQDYTHHLPLNDPVDINLSLLLPPRHIDRALHHV